MNKNCYKLIYSKRHNKIIAVGENASSISHSGARNQSKRGIVSHISYVARLSVCSFAALIALDGHGSAFAAPAVNALPTGASVAAGKVAISQSGNTLTVNQTTNQAIVNWNSFNIGANAKVNIVQPNASSVQLDRVTGNNPSQIFGQLTSNGQVILVNPNGIVFGKDGSVSASSFTASTLGISDADFLAGNYRYTRDGATGTIENNGSLQSSSGGYVALLGAQVTNNGKIIAPQGTAYLGAAEAITVPLSSSGKIKLELSPAAINTAVTNSSTGTIVAEGGQVYLQASALNDVAATAVSSVTNSGAIDVSGAQAGNVAILTDHGNIKVDGSIIANSTNPNNAGGNIIIGRDTQSGILSATTDVSGATLQAKGGFIETSGEYLKTDGVQITAKDWLLDPNNVEINTTSTANTPGDSVVKAGDISTALGFGTSVTIATGGSGQVSSATGIGGTGTISQATVGTGNTSDGNILVNSAITSTYNGSSIPTLTLTANNGITVGAGIGITGAGTGFNVSMTANGLGTTSQGIILNSAINAGTGTVSLTGATTNATSNGIAFNNGSGITASAYTATGNMNATSGGSEGGANGAGVMFRGTTSFSSTGTSSITGSTQSSTADGVEFYSSTNTTFNAGAGSLVVSSGSNNIGIQGVRFGYGGGATMNTSGNVTIGSTGNNYAKFQVQGTINASSGTLSLMGQSNTGDGVYFQDGGGVAPQVLATNAANISVTGVSTNANTGNGIELNLTGVLTKMTTNTGSITMNGTASGSGNGSGITFQNAGATSNVTSTGGGAISLTGTVGSGAGNGVSLYSGISTTGSITVNGTTSGTGYAITATNPLKGTNITLSATPTVNTGSAIYINGTSTTAAPLITATTGNVLIKTTQGQINISDGSTTASTPTIKGTNVTIDNTGGAIDPTTGAITIGSGYAQTSRGLLFQDGNSNSGVGGGISATGNINIAAQSNSTTTSSLELAGPIAATGAVNFYGAQTGLATNNNGIYLYANANISGSTVAMTGVAGTAGGAGIYINNNVAITGNATTGTAVSLTGTAKAAGVTGIQTGSSSVIEGYSDVTLTGINTAAPTAAPLNLAGTIIGASGKSINLTGGTTGAGGITTNGAAVKFSNPYSLQNSYSGVIANGTGTGTGTVENNQGTQTLTGTSTYSGGTNVNAGTLQVGDASTVGTLGPGTINIASGATLNYFVKAGASTLYNINNTITGTGTLQKTGTGTLNWGSGAATFEMSGGLIDVQAGTFIGSSGANEVWTSNKSSLNIASGANFSGVEGVIYVDALTGSGTLMSGNGGATPNIIVGVNGTAAGTTNNVTGVAYNSAGTATFSGVIADQTGASTGPANITKTGSGTQILTGTNTYTGTTTVSGGTLQVGASSTSGTTGTLGTGAVTLSGGSTLSYQRAANTTINNVITGTGNVIANITGTLTDSSAINLTSGSVNLSATGNVLLSANIGASSGVSVTAGSITGTGAGASSTSTLTSAANTSITNTGTGGITLATTGTGNLTTANIVDSGSGNVNIIAGSALLAGNTSGNVLTTNTTSPVTLGSGDNLYVYSGSESATGSLSILNSSFSTLNLANSGLSVNALNYTAYGTSANPNTISGGGTAQVMFRDITAPTYNLTLANLSKVYGASDPTLTTSALQSAYTAAGGSTNITGNVGGGANTFAELASTAISGLNLSGAARSGYGTLAGEQVGTYAYSGITGTNLSITAPSLGITKATLYVTANAINSTYNGTSSYNSLAGYSTSGLVSSVDGVTTGDAVNSVTTAFNSGSIVGSGIAQAGSFTQTLSLATGTGLSNYNINYVGVTGNVAKANLTFTGNSTNSVVYSGNTQTNTYSVSTNSGIVNSTNALGTDVLNVSGMATGRNVVTGGVADNLSVTGSAATLANYTISTTNGKLLITPATLTINAVSDSKTYDGSTASSGVATYSTSAGNGSLLGTTDTLTGVTQTFASKNVLGTNSSTLGIASYTVNDGNNGNNYSVVTHTAFGTITPAVLTASLVGSVSKTYDGGTTATIGTGNIALSGVVSGESVNVANTTGVVGTYASANVLDNLAGSGSVTAINLSSSNLNAGTNTLLSNYVLSGASSSITANVGTITPKALTLNGLTVADKVYDATTTATVNNPGSLSGVVGVDVVSVNGVAASFADANAGINKSVLVSSSGLTGSSASNYSLNALANTTAAITAAPLSVSGVAGVERNYTGLTNVALDTSNASISGLKGSDSFSLVAGSGNYLDPNAGTGKTLNITGQSLTPVGSTLASNYSITYQTSALGTVDKTPITATLNNVTTTYGAVAPLTYSVNGLVNNETASTAGISITGLSSTGYTGTSTTNNVGSYAITASSVQGQNYQNYTLSAITPGTLAITPATLTFTAGGNSKIVTQADPTLSYATSGLVNGDSASVITSGPTLTRAAGETAGTYAISMSGGAAGSNYIIANVVPSTSTFQILGASALLITMNSATTTYGTLGTPTIASVQYLDGNNNVIKNLTNTGGTTWSDGVGGTISINPSLQNVTVNSGVGSYAYAVSALNSGTATSSGNFNLVRTQTGTYTVDPASLLVTANNASRIYDGSTYTTPSATVTGLMNGETVAGLGGLTYTGSAINSRDVGTYSINAIATTPSNFSNYSITYQSGTLTTSQALLSLSGLTVANKVYDGSTAASLSSLGTLSGIVSGDNVNLVAGAASFVDSNAGVNKTVNLTSLGLTGTNAGNYTLVNSSGVGPSLSYTATITPKTITATGVTANDKTYDTTAGATLNTSGITLNGVLSTDNNLVSATTAGLTGTFADANAGSNKSVSITGYGLTGQAAGNYQLANNYTTTTTANIAQANAYVTTASSLTGNTYNGSTYSLAAPVISGVYTSDSANVGTSQINNSGINAGSYTTTTTLTGNATTLNNYNFHVTEGTLVIDKANLTVSAVQGLNLVFNGQTQNQTDNIVGLVSGDNITVNGLVSQRNAGNYNSNLSLSGSSTTLNNYNVTLNDASFNIAKAQITANTASSNVTYDGSTQSLLSPTVNGIISGTNVQVAQTGTSLKNVGSTTSSTTLTGVDANNYALTAAEGTLTVGQANVGVTINSASTTYNGLTQSSSGYSVTSGQVFGSDNLGITGDLISARNAGSYTSNATASNSNYAITINQGSLVINQANLTVSANTGTGLVFNGQTQNQTNTTTGLVGGDVLSINGLVSARNAGNYTSNLSLAGTDPTTLGNYNITLNNASFNIAQAPITANTASSSVVYNGSAQSLANPIISGVISGTNVQVAQTGNSLRNVGSTTSATSLTGSDAANYLLTATEGTLTIAPASLIIKAAADTKVYDGSNVSSVPVVFNGLQGSDSASATQVFNSPNVLGTNTTLVSSYTVNDGNSGNNYQVSTQTGSGSITPAPVVISGITAANKVYDGTTLATLNTSGMVTAGVVSGQAINTAATGAFDSPSVGNGKTVNLSLVNTAGINTDLTNYNISNQSTTTADITANSAPVPPPSPLPPNINPVSPTVVPSSTQSASIGVSFGSASIEESNICGTKRACNCDATGTAGVEICYSIDVDSVKPKLQLSKLVGGKW
ncbi:filamentous hemagglutinin family protein [Polynucleobacter sphagniphilus]|uniref:YDG domain-containing protein n=1 Tax=Polynucleobacter sphagniphilus TaxID=1743169 RepID=UPI002476A074|nr:YDG domain-containing protein [Polynucleobacter sphagniphilus]MDH6242125.1 filamentous hemagglutinin family protein [Polynucleobacter sphagniphilus]